MKPIMGNKAANILKNKQNPMDEPITHVGRIHEDEWSISMAKMLKKYANLLKRLR